MEYVAAQFLLLSQRRLSTYCRQAFAVAAPTMFSAMPWSTRSCSQHKCTTAFRQSLKS